MFFLSIVEVVNLLKYHLIIKPICYIYMGYVHILQSSFTLVKVYTLLMPILTLQEAITIMFNYFSYDHSYDNCSVYYSNCCIQRY